jgi:hypothetical protein
MQNQENEFIKFLAYITALNKIIKKAIETHKGTETLENKRAKFTYIIN